MAIVYNPETGQYEDDGGQQTPNIPDVTNAPPYGQTHQVDAGGNPLPGTQSAMEALMSGHGDPSLYPANNAPRTGEQYQNWFNAWVSALGHAPSSSEIAAFQREYGTGTAPNTNTNTSTSSGTPFTGGMAEFIQQFGSPSTPAQLAALEQRLNAAGITIARNAAGVAGKIRLPNGQIIDVINSADRGGLGFQWLEGGGDANGNGQGSDFALNPDYLAPFTTPFEPGADTQLPTPPGGQPFAYPDFNVPDPSQIALDPSYQFRLNQGIDAIKSNKAAMGTLNTGGTIKDYMNYGQGAASQEYSNIFDRNFRTWGANRDNAFGSWAANTTQANTGFGQQKSLADDAYSRAWTRYRGLEDIFRANQNGPASKLLSLASIGSNAASV